MPNIGPTEILIVVVIALVVLGPKRLPDAGRSLGRSLREFRREMGGAGEPEPEPLLAQSPQSGAKSGSK